jgi:cytochrome d ubiquinol oxidase subunit I
VSAEVGRQPWVVYGLLRTEDAVSKTVPPEQVLASLVLFSLAYLALFSLWIFVINEKIRHGPEDVSAPPEGPPESLVRAAASVSMGRGGHSLTETDSAKED